MRVAHLVRARVNILLCISLLQFASGKLCGQTANVTRQGSCSFALPVVPTVLTQVAARAEYVAEHYWHGLDYANTAWLGDSSGIEQIFVDWIPVLAELPQEKRARVAETIITCGNGYPAMQLRLGELAECYFNGPNSPYRNEDLYIPVLRALIADSKIEDIYKERYRFQLERALKNRRGTPAADFAFITREHQRHRLADLNSDYVLLYFFNPDCSECKRVTAYVGGSSVFSALLDSKRLTILALYPDDDLTAWENHIRNMPQGWTVARYADAASREAYYLPAIPNLYLLDGEKKVILKDAPVELIERWLQSNI